MKRPLKPNMVRFCMCFAAAVAAAFSLPGCASREVYIDRVVQVEVPVERKLVMIPLIDDIIAEVGGIESTPQFQFYISKTITLSIVEGQSDSRIEDGQVVRRGSTMRNNVTILAYTPGVLFSYLAGSGALTGNRLNVAFEEYPGNPVVTFARQGASERYEILYADRAKSTISYGGLDYTVDFTGSNEPPYLMITTQENTTESGSNRRVTGLTLGQ